MRQLIVATGNMDKLREIREILNDPELEILSMKEAGISADIVEDGSSFAENAAIKAGAVAKASGRMALADDSGLVIDCLRGEPGIYSARYMGRNTSYDEKNRNLIDRVNDFCRGYEAAAGKESGSFPGCGENGNPGPLRAARFVCAVCAAWPDGTMKSAEGRMEGRIAYRQAGENGFGYDPIFFLPEYGRTSAEISEAEKNAISHRGKAFRAMREILQRMGALSGAGGAS